ncbi:MAG TPA: UDP-glucose/GDP-mannose dehydrogenase family protein [Terriglobales bacterium]|nr:UDP-glucose/GDP-mannose dehydrogenase family protein [Terriglobales bacterium]
MSVLVLRCKCFQFDPAAVSYMLGITPPGRGSTSRLSDEVATKATYICIDSQVHTNTNGTPHRETIRIAVIGSGYVGLVAGACFAEIGHEVTLVDSDERKISALRAGKVPIHEEFLPELITKHAGTRLSFTQDLAEAVRLSDVVFIAVGTPPTEDGHADLSYVEQVACGIAGAIDRYKVVVEKSTVPVYTNEWVRRTMIRNGAPEDLFGVVSNPEFLREGTAVTDFLYPDRIVIGADTDRAAQLLQSIYAPLTSGLYYEDKLAIPKPAKASTPARLILTSAKSAELIKHASNAFLALKISFVNAVANICEQVGADVGQVTEGIGSDSRIGSRFLRPGIGYGGSCFPKDVSAFQAVAAEAGYEFRLLEEVSSINLQQRRRFLRKVRRALWNLRGKNLGVLGLSFKGGTDDIRESPAIAIIESLLHDGCRISVYDPAAMEHAKGVLHSPALRFAGDAYDAAHGADALLILTDWEEFANLDLNRLKKELRHAVIVDGRNLYRPAQMVNAGFMYSSVGRPDAMPVEAAHAGLNRVA